MAEKTFIIQGETIGRGDEQLGYITMANLLRFLCESKDKPGAIIFWNTGVRLICEGSPVINHIKQLEKQGVEVLACTTCLEYFDLEGKILVGKPTTMLKSIARIMNDDIVTL